MSSVGSKLKPSNAPRARVAVQVESASSGALLAKLSTVVRAKHQWLHNSYMQEQAISRGVSRQTNLPLVGYDEQTVHKLSSASAGLSTTSGVPLYIF